MGGRGSSSGGKGGGGGAGVSGYRQASANPTIDALSKDRRASADAYYAAETAWNRWAQEYGSEQENAYFARLNRSVGVSDYDRAAAFAAAQVAKHPRTKELGKLRTSKDKAEKRWSDAMSKAWDQWEQGK